MNVEVMKKIINKKFPLLGERVRVRGK